MGGTCSSSSKCTPTTIDYIRKKNVNKLTRQLSKPVSSFRNKKKSGETENNLQFVPLNLDKDQQQRSALHFAAIEGDGTIIVALYEYMHTVDVVDASGRTPLHYAAIAGNEETLTTLLLCNPDIDRLSKDGTSPLHEAIIHNQPRILTLLLQKNANTNILFQDYLPALILAVYLEHKNIVELLIRLGVDPNRADTHLGRSALHYSAYFHPCDALRTLPLKDQRSQLHNKTHALDSGYSQHKQMNDSSTSTALPNSTTLSTVVTTLLKVTTSANVMLKNGSVFDQITKLLNGTQLYSHQVADYIEPEKFAVKNVHVIIWTVTVLTYVLAIPIAVRMIKTKAYLNVIDYFSFQIVLCAFLAWIPTLIAILHYWFESFSLRLCRLHYVLMSTNETVSIFFVFYMIIERFLYAHPSLKHKFSQFSRMYVIHLYAIFTWLSIMLIYALASPFTKYDSNSQLTAFTRKYCPYDYFKLRNIATVRSIIYFGLMIPALVLIGFVLRFFYQMRGTNQVLPEQKLWTMRVTSLLALLVFYDIYSYYLQHVLETYKSFVLSAILHSTFYLMQVLIIASTDPHWLEIIIERCLCLCCICTGRRRKPTIPVSVPAEVEFNNVPSSSSAGHYSLVDDTIDEEFDRTTDVREPTLRIIT